MTAFRNKAALAIALLLVTLAAVAYQSSRLRSPSPGMAAMLPQGALLSIESPDFAALLRDWNASPEQKSWFASDHYSVFSDSRLFGRLNDARAEFESAAQSSSRASTSLDGDFLTQIAGSRSIFAWYDIGNLEFLYITHLNPAQAQRLSLLKDRATWTSRQSAGLTFYLRKSSAGNPAQTGEQGDAAQGKARTVAFALVPSDTGQMLVLATREDLIANALSLVHPADGIESLASEPWYSEASATLPAATPVPALHMVLNLSRLVPSPYFRSYWVQRNSTDIGQYRAAVSDLYREPHQFREERSLLPNTAPDEASGPAQADLASLAALVPDDGVFTASASPGPAQAVRALQEKLLGSLEGSASSSAQAPDPTLDAQSGTSTDLETRIDTPPPVTLSVSSHALQSELESSALDALLTYSAAQPPSAPAALWIPIHSAVLLRAARPWSVQAIESALQQSLRGALTTSTLGIEFHPETVSGNTLYALSGPRPLFFAVSGTLCIVADDRALLVSIQQKASPRQQTSAPPNVAAAVQQLAGFNHTAQRAPFARITGLIDGTNQPPATPGTHTQPAFFSGNLRSLSESFGALDRQRFTQRRDGNLIRQTVVYQWK